MSKVCVYTKPVYSNPGERCCLLLLLLLLMDAFRSPTQLVNIQHDPCQEFLHYWVLVLSCGKHHRFGGNSR
jgi:hypothetical protein